ncbi:class I SAM-dependent methyltransferase [Rhodoblastus sp.]|uniref:class I SAM-dependent methyltransferase n=1 Tax=Rhodoblastus sp. TaxID=1962975 RepID=UPI0035AE055E
MSALLEPFLRRLIRKGALEVQPFDATSFSVGDGGSPSCAIRLNDRRAAWELLRDPELAVGELYGDGRLELTRGGLYDLLALGARNIVAPGGPKSLALRQAARRLWQMLGPGIAPSRARDNASRHYDLDARLYRLFLDRDMQYSCALFETPEMSLDEAQLAKKRHIAAKLALAPGQKVLDIGCGWGGMACYLAEACGVEVLGVTLSREQLDIARQRTAAAGLTGRVRFALQDYREIEGRFDRIVSVGMFEHVGRRNYDVFFAEIARLLATDGVALIHTIGHFGPPEPTSAWLRKYIFPDGYIPALAEIAPALARSGLAVADLETLREHYALTLDHWRARFQARRDEAQAIYDERFCRIWEYYLAASQCAFRYQGCAVLQFQLIRSFNALPITRDYLFRREAELRAGGPAL